MAVVAVLDGVPEPTTEFKVSPAPLNENLRVVAPAHLSKNDALAYVRKNYKPNLDCRRNPWACVDPLFVRMPLRTFYPRTILYVALAVAIPALALIIGLIAAWCVRSFAFQDVRFGNMLVVSVVFGALAVLAEIGIALTFPTPGAEMAGRIAAMFCLLSVLAFVVGLFLFGREGLWLGLPTLAAFFLPVGVIVWLSISVYNCEHDPHVHAMCVP